MKKYDSIVVGSGITGLTMTRLLTLAGKKVLLLEKGNVCGGCMQRFCRNGVRFDTGFHFTTGAAGCFGDMLKVLGIYHDIEFIPIEAELILGRNGRHVVMGHSRKELYANLCRIFPDEVEKIRRHFDMEQKVFESTPMFHLQESSFSGFKFCDEDFITLKEWLEKLGVSRDLAAILASFTSCHGTPAGEMPLSSHCRVSYGLEDDLERVRGGGTAFIEGLLKKSEEAGAEIRTRCTIAECLEPSRKACHQIRLTDGSEVEFDELIMTIHPKAVSDILPESVKTADFCERIAEGKESCGFFSVNVKIDPPVPGLKNKLISFFSGPYYDKIVNPETPEVTATGMMFTVEDNENGIPVQAVTCFRSVFPEETAKWENTQSGHRGDDYLEYKRKKTAEILDDLLYCAPELEGHIHVCAASSMLTFRDYLSPTGSGYGLRKGVGQQAFFGKLPIRNFYICGQSAMLPGAMGGMLSAFIIWRKIIGEEKYLQILNERLGGLK